MDSRESRLIEFANKVHAQFMQYHNHKETMANAVLTIELAFVAWLFVSEAPKWTGFVGMSQCNKIWLSFILLNLLLVSAHVYLLRQLAWKRVAAHLSDHAWAAAAQWVREAPKDDKEYDQVPHVPEEQTWQDSWGTNVFPMRTLPTGSFFKIVRSKMPVCLSREFADKTSPAPTDRLLATTSLAAILFANLVLGFRISIFA
jgi:hypothetical protein